MIPGARGTWGRGGYTRAVGVYRSRGIVRRLNRGEASRDTLCDPFGPLAARLEADRVSFVLEIPEREQADLLSTRFLLTHSQRFRVEIRYGFRMPVALVETLDPVRRPSPSQGVRVVREWLTAKVGGATTALDFQCLGPSPLHAEFFLTPIEDPSDDPWLFRLDVIEQRGYDDYQFEFNPHEISEEEPLDVLLDDLADELDLYYEIVGSSVRHMRMWDRADRLTWSVVRLHETRGLRAWVRKALTTGRVLNEAFVALAELEGTARLSSQEIERSARSTYKGDEPTYLERLVRDEREEMQSYPIGESRGLLELIEKRRLSGREVLALLASAVGGGLIGALVAALLASGPERITISPPRVVPIVCRQEKAGHIVCSLTTNASTQPKSSIARPPK